MVTLSDTELPVTEDIGKYKADNCRAKIIGFLDSDGYRDSGRIEKGREMGIVLDRTCFYAEAGGQVGDTGTIAIVDSSGKQKALFLIENTTRIANCVIHTGKVAEGTFAVGDKVKATVSRDRDATKKNHTATHLLQWALQQVVGKSVAQQGSLVGPDYLRFDFTCPAALTGQQIKEVEKLVREKIAADEPVTFAELPRDEAKKLGAMALFSEKYGEEVRVVCIGAESEKRLCDAFSREFCGGTHVDRLGIIGGFKIIREESISAGVRRITALTGRGLEEYLEKKSDILDVLSALLKSPAEGLVDRVNQLLVENKRLAKEIKGTSKLKGSDIMLRANEMLETSEKIGQSAVIVGRLSDTNIEQARSAIDMLKKKAKSAAIVVAFADGDKVTLLAGVTDDLVAKGLSAADLIKQTAPIVGGGGGGRPHLAQAGGKDAEKIDQALEKASQLIREKLGGG
jgi:alanyl-tRNA synthetase